MKRVSEKTIQRLREAADRAARYRWKFEDMLQAAKQAGNWEEVAEAAGIHPSDYADDWLC
jgi:hypothetical protein